MITPKATDSTPLSIQQDRSTGGDNLSHHAVRYYIFYVAADNVVIFSYIQKCKVLLIDPDNPRFFVNGERPFAHFLKHCEQRAHGPIMDRLSASLRAQLAFHLASHPNFIFASY
jgi:hypothetical protein